MAAVGQLAAPLLIVACCVCGLCKPTDARSFTGEYSSSKNAVVSSNEHVPVKIPPNFSWVDAVHWNKSVPISVPHRTSNDFTADPCKAGKK